MPKSPAALRGKNASGVSLRERVADALAYNDMCGVGPLTRSEYLEDADALIALIVADAPQATTTAQGGTNHPDPEAVPYPYPEGDWIVVGPECVYFPDDDAIAYKGTTYVPKDLHRPLDIV